MSSVQWITVALAFLFLIQVISYSVRNQLRDRQAFLWFSLSIIGLLAAFGLEPLNRFAAVLGISYMPALVFAIAFLVVLNVLMYQSIVLSQHEEKIKTLIQEIALIKHEQKMSEREEEKDERQ
ncbi:MULTISPECIES: DUF2304 domain-containing protein [Geobacillus]|jgi:hypothetical protein|uniref:DUF2304 domain-containing protein n=1 Tax=Geobacillus TaxID=129337 RepID=UPI0003FD3507|nr:MULTISPECIES: DUF2304 domain-containing protein [Geobacillus]ARA98455.1 hypothetical protein GD3902_10665 [Geobacillus thermodenitrificans]ATO37833.1 hypothetical protein GTID1_11875 [Geobacillus thermodenitrificans]KQB92074.1 hypothetical protein GEPA3_3213 [Geobacillus sp. PA-3]NNU88827.1 DUF2304 domain-containing protein [Geobacillus sp. MR]OQP08353.1 hypothetical protein B1691_15850 [Geobacillus sp. 47C-IIb]